MLLQSSISKYGCIHMNPKSRTPQNWLFRNMAAISALKRIWNVPISKDLCILLP